MQLRPPLPPIGFMFVDNPNEATHVWDHDQSIVELPGAYSRSLLAWLKKISVKVEVIADNKITHRIITEQIVNYTAQDVINVIIADAQRKLGKSAYSADNYKVSFEPGCTVVFHDDKYEENALETGGLFTGCVVSGRIVKEVEEQ